MRQLQRLFAFALLPSLLLSCSGGILGTGDGGSTDIATETPYTYRYLPNKIGLDFPLPLLEVERTGNANEGIDESDLNQLVRSQSAYGVLHDQIAELTFRNQDILRELMVVDSVWDEVVRQCEGRSPCQLPPKSILAVYTPAMAAFAWRLDKAHIERFVHLSEAEKAEKIEAKKKKFSKSINDSLDLGQVRYEQLSNSEYDIAFDISTSINNSTYQIQTRWSEDRQRVYVQGTLVRGPGLVFHTQYRFHKHADGDAITMRDTLNVGPNQSALLLAARGVTSAQTASLVKSNISLQTAQKVYSVLTEGDVNDAGGFLVSSVETLLSDGSLEQTQHIREAFNNRDTLSQKEVCEGLPTPAECTEKALWKDTSGQPTQALESSPYYDANILQDSWEKNFLLPEVQIANLPDSATRYVLVRRSELDPEDSLVIDEDILCSGQNFPSDKDLYCWGDRNEIFNAAVYAVQALPDGSGFQYQYLPQTSVINIQ